MNFANPALALDILDPWFHDGGRNSNRFQEFAEIASDNAEDDFDLIYDSYVGLAVFALGCVSRHTRFAALDKIGAIRRAVLSGQVELSIGRVEAGGELAARLTPFLNRVAFTLGDRDSGPIPDASPFQFQVSRTFDVISSFVVSLIEMHVNVSDIPDVSAALDLYRAAVEEVLG